MARRIHANMEGGNTSNNLHDEIYEYNNDQNNSYKSYEYSQDNYGQQVDFGYQSHPNLKNPELAPNYNVNYAHSSNNSAYSSNNTYDNPISAPHSIFPSFNQSPVIQQSSQSANYGSHSSKISWIAAFSSGGFENEPSLMEELGINFSHIKDKTLASLNPFRKLDSGTLNDADLTGPLLFCFLFGTSLLFSGKVHFGYIYGVATLGWISIFSILNLMTEKGVSFYLTASILGYCLLPMVLLSAMAILLKLRGIIGLVLGITSVSWCTFSSSTYFVEAFGMKHQQILIAYPIFLLYSCFALMTIF